MHKVFGIRHHGPGSSRHLLEALNTFQPDCILIESPEDTQAVLEFTKHKKLVPPVAVLVYNPKDFIQTAFYPFAKFSPEWQAIKFGNKKKIPVSFIDLAQSIQFCLKEEKQKRPKSEFDRISIYDPLLHMARLAGYEDSEAWWDIFFEQVNSSEEVFDIISEMMHGLRKEIDRLEDKETLLREACMRGHIRAALKEHQKVAVVCGAWHVPALEDLSQFKVGADKNLLKGLKKVKCDYTWIPWTYERLARSSGYAAGVISPAWYEILFDKKEDASIRWLSKVARLLRKKDLQASSANIIEAVKLSHNLAAIRDKGIAGIEELKEAGLTTFCNGNEEKYALIEEKLIVGDVVGKVPKKIPSVPLQKDLEKSISSARMTKEYNSSESITKLFDLRKENGLKGSKLIHRLNLLSIPWGKARKGSQFASGSFKETWKLKWRPEYVIRIIEASMWGNTVIDAAENFVRSNVGISKKLAELTEVLDSVLKADLPNALAAVLKAIQDKAILESDILELMDAIPSLIDSLRYGNTRGIDLQQIEQVCQEILPRIFIGLPVICINVSIDLADDIYERLVKLNYAIQILDEAEFSEAWVECLKLISGDDKINPKLRAISARLLFDKSIYDIDATSKRMHFELSRSVPAMQIAYWLEGFLFGSAQILIHNPAFWQILDDWIELIKEDHFLEIVPILRRTFSSFSAAERKKMMGYVLHGRKEKVKVQKTLDKERVGNVLPILGRILGLETT